MQISRIPLSDKTDTPSHTPRYATARGQADEPKVPVQVREWIGPAPTMPDLVLVAQPPTQPRSGVAVNRAIRAGIGPYSESLAGLAPIAVYGNGQGLSFVILEPLIPTPAISPFWSKMNA